MRQSSLCLIALLVTLPASAQSPSKAKTPAGPETRYFRLDDGVMGGNADAVLKEVRQGNAVTASTLDVCYDAEKGSDRKDRFVANLAVQGNARTATTQSITDKKPVTVKFTQRPAADGIEFKGEISVGSTTTPFSSTDTGLGETEFEEIQSNAGMTIATSPADFTEVSAMTVGVKVRVEAAADYLKSLRGQSVEITAESFNVSCADLRSGTTTISLVMDPFRAPAFVANAKSLPGVVEAGWMSGSLDMARAIRFGAADWREGDRPNRTKIAAVLIELLEKAYRSKLDSSEWNDTTGNLTLILKRPSESYRSLGLTEVLDFTVMLSADRPNATERLVLWIGVPNAKTRDDGPGSKFIIADPGAGDDGGGMRSDPGVMEMLASRFAGQRWDNDTSNWK